MPVPISTSVIDAARSTPRPFAQTLHSTATLMVRALREDARHMRYHLVRLAFVLVALWLLIMAHDNASWTGAPGREFFQFITWLNLIGITVAGISFFSSAITEEKEERTLGLLRMAGISPVALLLGKSTSRLVSAALLLSVQLPFTWLAITLGGVTWHQVIAAYCGVLAYMVLLANLALFFSVVCKTTNRAVWMTACSLFAFVVLTVYAHRGVMNIIAFGTASQRSYWLVPFVDWFASTSIFARMNTLTSTGFAEPAISFQVVSNLVAAAALFLLSWLVFERFNREESPASPSRWRWFRRPGRVKGLGAGRPKAFPLAWKDFHFISGGKPMLIARFLLYPALVAGIWFSVFGNAYNPIYYRQSIHTLVGAITMLTMMALFGLELAVIATRIFGEEIKWQTLSSLMILPRSVGSIAYAKLAGCLLGLFPAVFYFCVGVWLDPEGFNQGVDELFFSKHDPLVGVFLGLQIAAFLHLVAYFSLITRWGAIPGAAFLVIFTNGCCGWTASSAHSDFEYFAFIMGTIATMVCLVLQMVLAEKLQSIAAK